MPWSRPTSIHFKPASLMQSSPGSTLWILVAVSATPSSLLGCHLSSLQALTTISIPLLKGLPKLGDSSTFFLEAALKSFTHAHSILLSSPRSPQIQTPPCCHNHHFKVSPYLQFYDFQTPCYPFLFLRAVLALSMTLCRQYESTGCPFPPNPSPTHRPVPTGPQEVAGGIQDEEKSSYRRGCSASVMYTGVPASSWLINIDTERAQFSIPIVTVPLAVTFASSRVSPRATIPVILHTSL